jgi:hypothetical protein
MYLYQNVHRGSLSMFMLAHCGNVAIPMRDCLKIIRIQLLSNVLRSHLPVR